MSTKASVTVAALAGLVTAVMVDNAKPKQKVYLRHLNKEVRASLPHPDLSAFEGVNNENYQEITLADVLSIIVDKQDALIMMARTTCPWSQKAMPVLDKVLTEEGVKSYYVDADSMVNKNPVIRKTLTKHFAAFLKVDDEGQRQLYVPCFVMIKKGEVIGVQVGTLGFLDRPLDPENEEEMKELYDCYQDMVEVYKGEEKK